MRGRIRSIVMVGLMLLLAACNSTDPLTPQASIPGAADQTVAETPRNESAERVPVDVSPIETQRAPQNTLEAQAQALEQGEPNPVATENRQPNSLLGANLYKKSEAAPVKSIYTANNTIRQSGETIRFLPIIGAPVGAVTPLSRELGQAARANGLAIKASSDSSADHVLKGYLSAYADGKEVTVIYVWDVLDGAGTRLHRIQGQEKVPSRGKETWEVVPADVMRGIGVETIAEYMKWKSSRT